MKTPQTQEEIIAELKADTPLNRARRLLSSHAARDATWTGCPIEHRRIEFEMVVKIAEALGYVEPPKVDARLCEVILLRETMSSPIVRCGRECIGDAVMCPEHAASPLYFGGSRVR
jgi:aromatic ring hydroxylase